MHNQYGGHIEGEADIRCSTLLSPGMLLSFPEWPELEGQSCVPSEPRRLPRGM